jgi:hypothetical protein
LANAPSSRARSVVPVGVDPDDLAVSGELDDPATMEISMTWRA